MRRFSLQVLSAFALIIASPLFAQFYEPLRIGSCDWSCRTVEHELVSCHQRWDTARASCEAWSIANRDADGLLPSFRLSPAQYLFTPTAYAQSYPGAVDSFPPIGPTTNDPPVWDNLPDPACEEGQSCSYDLNQDFTDPEGAATTCAWNAGSAARPTGVTLSGCSINDNGTAADGVTTGLIVDIDDGVNDPVASGSFSYTITPSGSPPVQGELLWVGDFEGGPADITGTGAATYKTALDGPGELSVVTSGTGGCAAPRYGTYMGKAEIFAGGTGNAQRAEFRERPSEQFLWDGTVWWIGGSLCYDSFNAGQNTHVQIHASNEGPTECDMAGNGFGVHGNGTWEVIDNPSGISEGSGANSNHITVYSTLFTSGANLDTWHDVVVKIKANTDHTGIEANCNGEYSIWHNGTLVASDTAACNVNYKDACGTVIQPPKNKWTGLSVGLYRSNNDPMIGFWDEWRIAKGANAYDLVDPAQND